MSPAPSRSTPWICLLLAALTAASLYPVLQNRFVNWDDMEHVARNPDMNPPTFASVERYWTKPYFGLYIPVTYTAWLATSAIASNQDGSLNPAIFHALNLAIHTLAAILVFLILRRLINQNWPAAAGAAIFAVHPIQVEAVAWVSGLRDVLSGALSLAAILIYLRSTDTTGPSRTRNLIIATFLFILALLSKPTAVVTPILLAIILGKRTRSELRWLTLWLLLAIYDLLITAYAQPAPDVFNPPIWFRPIIALDALAFYVQKILIPAHFLIDYSRSPDWLLSHPTSWWAAAIAAIVLIAIIALRKKIPRLTIAIAISIASLLPVLGLASFNFQYFSTVADRYAYLAMLGTAFAFALFTAAVPRIFAIALVIAALAATSNVQSRVWQSTATLCNHALAINPGSVAALRILTFESQAQHDWQSALRYNTRALQTKPDDPLLLFDRANTLRDADQPTEALTLYARSLIGRPNDPQLRNNYAVLLAQQGKDAAAAHQFAILLQQFPNDAQARVNWATYLATHGQRDKALIEFHRALTNDPNNPTAQRAIKLLTPKTNDK